MVVLALLPFLHGSNASHSLKALLRAFRGEMRVFYTQNFTKFPTNISSVWSALATLGKYGMPGLFSIAILASMVAGIPLAIIGGLGKFEPNDSTLKGACLDHDVACPRVYGGSLDGGSGVLV
jgi:hypothetical protein